MEEQRKKRKRIFRRKRKQRKTSIISNIVLVVAIIAFVFSGYKLYTIFSEYNKGDSEYNSIFEKVITIGPSDNTDETAEEKQEDKKEPHVVLNVDFAELQAINPDVVAWISFDSPKKISYPVVRGSDNDKYLKTTVEGEKNSAGAIFMDANNAADFTDRNTFIYGHNMKNGSMFGQLRKYKNVDFYKDYPYFYIYTPDGKEVKYQVYAVCIVEDTSESYNKMYTGDDDYMKYLQYIKSISRYDTGVEVTANSQLVSLSTCTNVTETQRLLVHGVKVEEPVPEGQVEDKPAEETIGEQ